MPNVSDQMKGTPLPFPSQLAPLTSRAELIALATVADPPSVGSTREPPFTNQTIPMSSRHGSGVAEHADPTVPTRSPAALAPNTVPCRLSSCSTCHELLIRLQ